MRRRCIHHSILRWNIHTLLARNHLLLILIPALLYLMRKVRTAGQLHVDLLSRICHRHAIWVENKVWHALRLEMLRRRLSRRHLNL